MNKVFLKNLLVHIKVVRFSIHWAYQFERNVMLVFASFWKKSQKKTKRSF